MSTRYNITVYGREMSLERIRIAQNVAELSRSEAGLVPVGYSDLLDRVMVVAQAKDSSELMGHLSLKSPELDESLQPWRQVSTYVVAPKYRGMGVGGALLAVAAGVTRLQDTNLYAYAMDDNPEGLRYFERHGYHQEEIFGRVGMVQRCGAVALIKELIA